MKTFNEFIEELDEARKTTVKGVDIPGNYRYSFKVKVSKGDEGHKNATLNILHPAYSHFGAETTALHHLASKGYKVHSIERRGEPIQEELELNETDIPKRVTYKPSDPNRLAHEEHNEITYQSQGLKSGDIAKEHAPHPAIQKAIHKLAHKPAFITAMKNSTIKHIKPSSDKHVITNSDIGSGKEGMKDLDKSKQRRIQQQTNSSSGIDRPIVLSHHDKKTGITHTHLVAGNTRATHVGHGVEAHHITV